MEEDALLLDLQDFIAAAKFKSLDYANFHIYLLSYIKLEFPLARGTDDKNILLKHPRDALVSWCNAA
jgi:hypothetical protein